jgi:hypothetical protein
MHQLLRWLAFNENPYSWGLAIVGLATIVVSNGEEITGRCLIDVLDALAAKLDNTPLPPMAA